MLSDQCSACKRDDIGVTGSLVWQEGGASASCAVQGPGAAKPATMAEVEELLREGKRLGLQLKGLPKLISMMAQARSFNMRARRALKRGASPHPPFLEV